MPSINLADDNANKEPSAICANDTAGYKYILPITVMLHKAHNYKQSNKYLYSDKERIILK